MSLLPRTSIENAIGEVDSLRTLLKKSTQAQIRSGEEKALVKATSIAWFRNHRKEITASVTESDVVPVDNIYKHLLASSEKQSARKKIVEALALLKSKLIELHSNNIVQITAEINSTVRFEEPPNFSSLVGNVDMQDILARRWKECVICINAKAPLAAVVMMGGLLEALFLARINGMENQRSVFTAKATPKNGEGKSLSLRDWTLKDYIEVAHELTWISETGKDIGVLLRDYRNYIHPNKELQHGKKLEPNDAIILWGVFQNLTKQVLELRN